MTKMRRSQLCRSQMRKSQLGMTLLEVMLAFVIFALSALSILGGTTQHISNLTYLEEKTFANIVADNQLSLLQISGQFAGTTSGQTTLAGVVWYWQAKTVETQLSYVKAVDMSISKNEDHSYPLVTMRTYAKP